MTGILLALLSTILLNTADVGKKKMTHIFHPILAAWIPMFVGTLFFGIYFLFQGVPQVQWQPVLWYWIICSLLMITCEITFLWSIKSSDFSLSIPFGAFSPIFTLFVGIVMLGEVPGAVSTIGVFITVAGAYMFFLGHSAEGGIFAPLKAIVQHPGPRYMLMSAALFPLLAAFQKKAAALSEPLFFFSLLLMSEVIVFGIFLYKRHLSPWIAIKSYPALCISTSLIWGIGLGALYVSFSYTYIVYATSIKHAGLILAIAYGHYFFGEEGIRERLLAGGVMLMGVLLVIAGAN